MSMEQEIQPASDSVMQSTADSLIRPEVCASSRDATHGQVASQYGAKLSSENDFTQEGVNSENSNQKDMQRIVLSMNELKQQLNHMRSEILNPRRTVMLLKDLPENNENVNVVHTTPLDVILQDVQLLNNVIEQNITKLHETVIMKREVSRADALEEIIFPDDVKYGAKDLTQENITRSDNVIEKNYPDILLSIDNLIEQVNQIRAENLNPQGMQSLPQQSFENVDLKKGETSSIDAICKEIRSLKNVIKKEGIKSPENANLIGRLSSLSSITEEGMISREDSIESLSLDENITLQEDNLLPESETILNLQSVSGNPSPKHLCASLENLNKQDEPLAENPFNLEFDKPSENVMLEEVQSTSENVQEKTQLQGDDKTLSQKCPIEQTSPENLILKNKQSTPEKLTLQDNQSSPENIDHHGQFPSCNVAEQKQYISSQIENLHENLLTPENVFDFMTKSRICDNYAIFQKCLRILQSQTRAALSSGNFKKAVQNDILEVLKLPALGLEREVELLHYIIQWLQWNDYTPTTRDTFLQNIDIKALSVKEFADTVEKFPQFFNDSEVAAIFMSLTKPSSRDVPNGWSTSVRSHSMFYTDASLTSVFRDFQDYALKLETTTGMFKHCARDSCADDSLEQSALLTFAIKLSKKFPEEESALVMLELAFGQESLVFPNFEMILYVGEYNEFSPKAVDIIEYWLVSTEGHYLIMLKNPWKIYKGKAFEFKIQFTLKQNRPDIMFLRLDQNKRGKSVLRKNCNYVGIRLLSTKLIFFKTLMNTNDFCISAFFIDSCKDYKRCLFRKNL